MTANNNIPVLAKARRGFVPGTLRSVSRFERRGRMWTIFHIDLDEPICVINGKGITHVGRSGDGVRFLDREDT